MIKETLHFLSRQEISGTVPRALRQSLHLQFLAIVTGSAQRHSRNDSHQLPNAMSTMKLAAITNMCYKRKSLLFPVFTGQQPVSHSYKTSALHPDSLLSPQDT